MKILFKSPELKSDVNRDEFFHSLEKIPAYKNIEKMQSHFLLELDNAMGLKTIQQLFSLFDEWSIDKSPLESFVQYVQMESEKLKNTIN
ncbi:MAG: hypothetical protein COB22_05635 [Cycloclasticus sp.]|nr:MAG: hypothetical protein COB22_05635 [Cycloclasticus sp.]